MTPPDIPDNVADLAAKRLADHDQAERNAYMDAVEAGEYARADGETTAPARGLVDKLRDRMVTGEALANIRPSPPLVDGVLYKGTTAFIAGAPKGGKTFLALDLVGAVLTGRDWQGRRTDPHPTKPVLYLAGEGLPEVPRRLTAWAVHHGYDPADLFARLVVFPGGGPFHTDEWRGAVAELAAEIGPQLVVVDTYSRHLLGGDENGNKDPGGYVATMDRIVEETGALMVTVHHTGKDPTKGMRGSTVILAACDTVLMVDGDAPYVRVKVDAQRNAEAARAWPCELVPAGTDPETGGHLSLVAVPRGHFPRMGQRAEEVADLLRHLRATSEDDAVSKTDLVGAAEERLGIGKTTLTDALNALRDEGRVAKGPGQRGRWWLVEDEADEAGDDPGLF